MKGYGVCAWSSGSEGLTCLSALAVFCEVVVQWMACVPEYVEY